jgi:hypothetical protein
MKQELAVFIILSIFVQPPGVTAAVVDAKYVTPDEKNVANTLADYGTIPGGVTLEGAALGLPRVETIHYDVKRNEFLLNGDLRYSSPVSRRETEEILSSIDRDRRLGVAVGRKSAVYGALPQESPVAGALKFADAYLGVIVFGRDQWMAGHELAEGYSPKKDAEGNYPIAAHFIFKNYQFEARGRELNLARWQIDATLVPLARKESNGTYSPDLSTLKENDVPEAFEANLQHVLAHAEHYTAHEKIKDAAAYGEVASFARALKQQGIDLDKLLRAQARIDRSA